MPAIFRHPGSPPTSYVSRFYALSGLPCGHLGRPSESAPRSNAFSRKNPILGKGWRKERWRARGRREPRSALPICHPEQSRGISYFRERKRGSQAQVPSATRMMSRPPPPLGRGLFMVRSPYPEFRFAALRALIRRASGTLSGPGKPFRLLFRAR